MKWFFLGLLLANLAMLGWNWQAGEPAATSFPLAASAPGAGSVGLTLLRELGSQPAARAEPAPAATPPQKAASPTPMEVPSPTVEAVAGVTSVPDAPVPKVSCLRLAGFDSQAAAAGAAQALKGGGAEIRGQGDDAGETKRYWVMLPPVATAAKAEPMLEQLKRAGIKDFYLIRSGDNKNAISLGVYSADESAKRRLRQIRDLKLNAKIEEITLPAKRWWLEFDWPEERKDEAWRKLLARDVRDMKSQTCH